MNDAADDLVPLDNGEAAGFDVVLRGYDRRQVDDYLDRVELALTDADQRHAEDGERLSALQARVQEVEERLTETARRAEGQPEPASLLMGRLAQMLALAESEAATLRASAQQEVAALREEAEAEVGGLRTKARAEADAIIKAAEERASRENGEQAARLEQREQEVNEAAETAEQATLQAQRDAEALRAQTQREAEAALSAARRDADATRAAAERDAQVAVEQARQDIQLLHERARTEAAAMIADADQKVQERRRQHDAISAQLQSLRDTIASAVGGASVEPAGRRQDSSPR